MTRSGLTHTRANPEEVATRIETIVEMMNRLEWDRSHSAGQLAKEWGINESTVRNYSAEASRVIARDHDPEAVKTDISIVLRRVMRTGKPIEQIKAADVWSKVAGVVAAQKIEISTDRIRFEALPPAEQAKALREKARECDAAAEDIERTLKTPKTKRLEA